MVRTCAASGNIFAYRTSCPLQEGIGNGLDMGMDFMGELGTSFFYLQPAPRPSLCGFSFSRGQSSSCTQTASGRSPRSKADRMRCWEEFDDEDEDEDDDDL